MGKPKEAITQNEQKIIPGLVALYEVWPGNGSGLFLWTRDPRGTVDVQVQRSLTNFYSKASFTSHELNWTDKIVLNTCIPIANRSSWTMQPSSLQPISTSMPVCRNARPWAWSTIDAWWNWVDLFRSVQFHVLWTRLTMTRPNDKR